MTTIDTRVVIRELDGTPIKDDKGKIYTVGIMIAKLLSTSKSSKTLDPVVAYFLAQDFYKLPSVQLKAEDVVLIKEEVKKADISAIIAGPLLEMLDGKNPYALEEKESEENNTKTEKTVSEEKSTKPDTQA